MDAATVDDTLPGVENDEFAEIRKNIKASKYGRKPKHSSVNIDSDNWFLTLDNRTRELLECPPSLKDGISREMEQELRYLGCELIQRMTVLLNMPQTAAATAQILFQRFYYQKSFAKYRYNYAVQACVLLASKIEESPRRCRHVINVYERLRQRERMNSSNDPLSKVSQSHYTNTYMKHKNDLIKTERIVLNTLGFVVHVNHPHKWISSFIHALGQINNTELIQKAWSYMNDGLKTTVFMRYQPVPIACACIFLAARTIKQPIMLPNDPKPWYNLFCVEQSDVEHIAKMLLHMYDRHKTPNWNKIEAFTKEIEESKKLATKIELGKLYNNLDSSKKSKTPVEVQKINTLVEEVNGTVDLSKESKSGEHSSHSNLSHLSVRSKFLKLKEKGLIGSSSEEKYSEDCKKLGEKKLKKSESNRSDTSPESSVTDGNRKRKLPHVSRARRDSHNKHQRDRRSRSSSRSRRYYRNSSTDRFERKERERKIKIERERREEKRRQRKKEEKVSYEKKSKDTKHKERNYDDYYKKNETSRSSRRRTRSPDDDRRRRR
uniref:CYCLIN domain-containing protein n=1 Tax=Rhabditophanes sp. KR3021 TaxID=114890 RepID=A0AC35TN97_9BILA